MNRPVIKTGVLDEFKENIIFENEKNRAFKNNNEFKESINKKYKYTPSSNLYRKIINYQIKKFGKSLDSEVCIPTHEEKIKSNSRANQRRYNRLKGWQCDKKLKEVKNK